MSDHEPLFDVPNLDGLNDDELAAFEQIAARLARIARFMRLSRIHALAGTMDRARMYQFRADNEYNRLPQQYRW